MRISKDHFFAEIRCDGNVGQPSGFRYPRDAMERHVEFRDQRKDLHTGAVKGGTVFAPLATRTAAICREQPRYHELFGNRCSDRATPVPRFSSSHCLFLSSSITGFVT
jgi:hypothetical protein